MNRKILLTSFQTWLPNQPSNSSDDLLEEIAKLDLSPSLLFLRRLPVDVAISSTLVISKLKELQPDAVICCGMAASRQILTVEACATCGEALDYIGLVSYCLFLFKNFDFKKFQYFLSTLLLNLSLPTDLFIRNHLDIETLVAGLSASEISYDAGKFVCEGLYYEVLKYLGSLNIPCIFVHVPILTSENLPVIVADFQIIMQRICEVAPIFEQV